jgi:hypothetical protein
MPAGGASIVCRAWSPAKTAVFCRSPTTMDSPQRITHAAAAEGSL